jgi:Flp pilus assembly protein CpaB
MHEKFEDLLLLYTTRSINAEQLAELRAHLAECPQCRASLNEWRAIASAVKAKAVEREHTYPQEKNMNIARPLPYKKQRFSVAAALTLIIVTLFAASIAFLNRPSTPNLQSPLVTPTPLRLSNGTIEIVIAARPIENGAVIHADDVQLYAFPAEIAPFNAIIALADAVGHIARTNIACGQVILQTHTVENAREVQQPQPDFNYNRHECLVNALSDTSNPIDEGYRVVNVVVAQNFIPAGSRIDLEDITTVYYPSHLRPAIAVDSVDNIAGRTAMVDIYREEMILINTVNTAPTHTPLPILIITPDNRSPFPTFTMTPTLTITPSATEPHTPAATFTLTPSATPANTWTITPMPTLTLTPSPTTTLTPTATPVAMCQVTTSESEGMVVLSSYEAGAGTSYILNRGTIIDVIEIRFTSGSVVPWYRVRALDANGVQIEGWIPQRAAVALPDSPCPSIP